MERGTTILIFGSMVDSLILSATALALELATEQAPDAEVAPPQVEA